MSRERKKGGLEWVVPRTEEEIAALRARMVAAAAENGFSDDFTCDKCGAKLTCTLAFDLYNTDGDCLAEK
jgi:hypothetical protein